MAGLRTRDERTLARFPDVVEFTPATGPRVRLAGFGLLMVAASAGLFLFPPVGIGGFNLLALIGWVGLIFFIPATTYALVRALLPRRALRLTQDGLTDSSSLSAVGFVPWAEVSGVGISEISGSRLIGLSLRDPAAFIAGLRGFRKIAARANTRMFGAPVWINPAGLPDAGDLASLIDVYRRGWALHNGVTIS